MALQHVQCRRLMDIIEEEEQQKENYNDETKPHHSHCQSGAECFILNNNDRNDGLIKDPSKTAPLILPFIFGTNQILKGRAMSGLAMHMG
eukprot:scaffold9046_cov60-Attheya_sp.AAC.3